MSERDDIPKVFRDYFEESGVLDTHGDVRFKPQGYGRELPINPQLEKPSWSDVIRLEVEELDYKIVAWKVVGEGAIASVIANERCVDPVAIIIGGPTNIQEMQEKEAKGTCGWSVIWKNLEILPGLVGYCEWGTSLTNYHDPDLERFAHWVDNAEDFINVLREQGRKEYCQ